MMAVLLSLLLGPGIGQLYNREYKKGAILLAAGVLVAIVMTVEISQSLMPYLTQDVASMDLFQLTELADRVRAGFSPKQSGLMMACYLIGAGLYMYSAIDAWFGAKRLSTKNVKNPQEASS